MKIDYKENQKPKQVEEPLWLSIIMGLAWFGLIAVAINLLFVVDGLMNL